MRMDDYDGQMMFGDLVGLKLPDIRLTGEEKPRKNLTQETCPDRESNPGPLRGKRACYHLLHSGKLGFPMSRGRGTPEMHTSKMHYQLPTRGVNPLPRKGSTS